MTRPVTFRHSDVAAKKAADEIYERLMCSTQDYLEENLRFNIASTLDTAERERKAAQDRVASLRADIAERDELLAELLRHSISHYGNPIDETFGVGLIHARARAAISPP